MLHALLAHWHLHEGTNIHTEIVWFLISRRRR